MTRNVLLVLGILIVLLGGGIIYDVVAGSGQHVVVLAAGIVGLAVLAALLGRKDSRQAT